MTLREEQLENRIKELGKLFERLYGEVAMVALLDPTKSPSLRKIDRILRAEGILPQLPK